MAITPEAIRAARAEKPDMRERELAAALGISEGELVAAQVGHGAVRIDAAPTRLIPLVGTLGEVMALTRNESAVNEKVGHYTDWHDGEHAAMTLGPDIDLRIFPAHWLSGFAVEKQTGDGIRRSLQIFDAHGDAVHKVHLREASDLAAWEALVAALRSPEQPETLAVTPRPPVEGPKSEPARVDELRAEWADMGDTHNFLRMVRRLKMNRLGAYRIVGAPFATPLPRDTVTRLLEEASARKTPIMIFVGNEGCIQIHSGPVERIMPFGPWINVLDPGYDLHLRADHVAEVWLVEKPTRHGPAISVEAFDAEGYLIAQFFGRRDHAEEWGALVAALPREEVTA